MGEKERMQEELLYMLNDQLFKEFSQAKSHLKAYNKTRPN